MEGKDSPSECAEEGFLLKSFGVGRIIELGPYPERLVC